MTQDASGKDTPEWGKASASGEERHFLSGPRPRGSELWHATRIFFEFIHGFRALHFVGPCVTVFGSPRFPDGHPSYQMARDMGAKLAEAGFTVMTGGGTGMVEAANPSWDLHSSPRLGGRPTLYRACHPEESASTIHVLAMAVYARRRPVL